VFQDLGHSFSCAARSKNTFSTCKKEISKKKGKKKKNVLYQAQEQHLVDRFSLMGFSSISGSAIESNEALAAEIIFIFFWTPKLQTENSILCF
jgi:hypothetical protein